MVVYDKLFLYTVQRRLVLASLAAHTSLATPICLRQYLTNRRPSWVVKGLSHIFLRHNDPAELRPFGPSARADCSRARISARGNDFNPLAQLSGVVPEARSAEGTIKIRRGDTDLRKKSTGLSPVAFIEVLYVFSLFHA
jgi:hypothetical protein